jgi:hypothetical protein
MLAECVQDPTPGCPKSQRWSVTGLGSVSSSGRVSGSDPVLLTRYDPATRVAAGYLYAPGVTNVESIYESVLLATVTLASAVSTEPSGRAGPGS